MMSSTLISLTLSELLVQMLSIDIVGTVALWPVLTNLPPIRAASGEVVKIAQLAAGASQGRIAQPETPVTLQFQGNKFTLSQSQLRQLTAGQPLQLHGNVLQIVSAPGQYLRPQGSVVLPSMPQGTNVTRNQPQVGASHVNTVSSAVTPRANQTTLETVPKSASAALPNAQESTEDRQRLLRERLDRVFGCNERRCGKAPVYGSDLLSLFTLKPADLLSHILDTQWNWTGSVNCAVSSKFPEKSSDLLRHLILSPGEQKVALEPVIKRTVCVVPAVIVPPPFLTVPHPPPRYTHNMKMLSLRLRVYAAPYMLVLRERTSPYCVQSPDLRLIQGDSGKLEALSILLHKLKSEGRRVLIFSQMLLMLDILETFLDFNSFTFLRIDENANYEQSQAHQGLCKRNVTPAEHSIKVCISKRHYFTSEPRHVPKQ
ncbi:unnamed protein product [Ranitomeya imitator]|uniref:Uncharacterized protein n=1 Tax=Ranitomeya imitator TaxID=111125 RepID=A0ABN9LPT3_9NEOB|nr:unnamed protein product [Ranitomeya imitator]